MGNELLSQRVSGKRKDPMTFFMKYYHRINFVKLLRSFVSLILIGDNKLFKTVLGTIEKEGPVVVKTYMNKISEISALAKYRETLEEMQRKLTLPKHPNVMPYQCLIQDQVHSLG